MTKERQTYDTLVIGGGIAGQEAALNLANMDYKVTGESADPEAFMRTLIERGFFTLPV